MTKPTYEELQNKVMEAESLIDALHKHEIDAIIGDTKIAVVRLKEAEDALRQSQARYQAIIDDQTELIARWRPDGLIIFVNQAYARFFSKSLEELIGTNFFDLIHEEDFDNARHCIPPKSSDMPITSCDFRVRQPQGQTAWLGWGTRAFFNENGEIIELQSVGRDITARKMAEQEKEHLFLKLQEKNEELQDFIHTIRHDFGNIVLGIQAFAENISRSCNNLVSEIESKAEDPVTKTKIRALKAEFIEDLDYILKGSAQMRQMLEGLKQIGQAGTTPIKFENLNMSALTKQVLGMLAAQIQECDASIITQPLPTCLGDQAQISQVFMNLVGNAIKYLDPNRRGVIEIGGAKLNEAESVYWVKDNGIGISKHDIPKLFKMFRRLVSQKFASGEGIGLAIVKRIIDRHNGRVWVESEPGKGSTFYITLRRV